MREILDGLESWAAAGHRFAVATVVETWGSSPRPVGAMMAVRDDGFTIGSVSGGCVEGAVTHELGECLANGRSRELRFEAISNEQAFQVGLSCGGAIRLWLEPDPHRAAPQAWNELLAASREGRAGATIIWLDTGERAWRHAEHLPDALRSRAEGGVVEVDGRQAFVHRLEVPPRLIIVGAGHLSIPLVALAQVLGFRTVVVDPRSALANPDRFAVRPDEIHPVWPKAAFESLELRSDDSVVVLTHDPKIDDVALAIVLKSPVRYIGALGSRGTQAGRRKSLLDQGFSEKEVDRIHGPVGLAIGAKSPEEIALSILAEVVQVRRAG